MNEYQDPKLSFKISTLLTLTLSVVCLLLAYSPGYQTLPPLIVWLLTAIAIGREFGKCRVIYFITAVVLLIGWVPLVLLTAIVDYLSATCT